MLIVHLLLASLMSFGGGLRATDAPRPSLNVRPTAAVRFAVAVGAVDTRPVDAAKDDGLAADAAKVD